MVHLVILQFDNPQMDSQSVVQLHENTLSPFHAHRIEQIPELQVPYSYEVVGLAGTDKFHYHEDEGPLRHREGMQHCAPWSGMEKLELAFSSSYLVLCQGKDYVEATWDLYRKFLLAVQIQLNPSHL